MTTSVSSKEWRSLARAVSGMRAADRAVLVNVVRKLALIEARQGPDVAEATLERLIMRLNGRDSAQMM